MPTTGTNAQLLLTAEITAGGTAATAGLVIMGMGRTVLQKVRRAKFLISEAVDYFNNRKAALVISYCVRQCSQNYPNFSSIKASLKALKLGKCHVNIIPFVYIYQEFS